MKKKTNPSKRRATGILKNKNKSFEKRIGNEIGERLSQSFDAFRKEIHFAFETFALKIDENAKKYRDDVLTKMDDISGQLETMRQENIIGSGQTKQLRNQIDNHEKRIRRLEQAN